MLDFDREQNCYGCGACAYVCPRNAIDMIQNTEGFLMPEVDERVCIGCGLCEKNCTFMNPYTPDRKLEASTCYAGFHKNREKLKESTSGGIAATLMDYFLSTGGYVAACRWTEDLSAEHMCTDDRSKLGSFKGSKYVQSNMIQVFADIEKAIKDSKKVLFIGTPCQTGAVRNVFRSMDNLYVVGLICGGVSSPKVWQMFKAEREKEYEGKMLSANFRYKGRYGWNTPMALYLFDNGRKVEKLAYQLDEFVSQYLYGIFKRNSCYQCGYKGDSINADLTIGDFWGSSDFRDKSENMGISAILCHTEKAQYLMHLIEKSCDVIQTDLETIVSKNQPLIKSVERSGEREKFFAELDKTGYDNAIRMYGRKTTIMKYAGMVMLDKVGLFDRIKRMIKD